MAQAAIATPRRKQAIPLAVRRGVALKYGCPPGGRIIVPCHYCGRRDYVHWHRLSNGRPSYWVSFGHHLDHFYPEILGGPTTVENLVLACRGCNLTKGAKV